MDIQHGLLSKVILEGTLSEAVSARITEDFFDDEQYAKVWAYLTKHWSEYGEAPTEDVVEHAFPTMQWDDYDQPTSYYVGQLLTRRRRFILVDALSASADLFQRADNDPDHVEKIFQELTDAISRAAVETAGTRLTDITTEEAVREYSEILDDRIENPGYLRGITTGFDGIDYVTGGFQEEHLIVLFGLPKSFKSATLLKMADSVHQSAESSMFVGFEMAHVEQMDRLISMRSGVNLNRILNGTLKPKEIKAIELAQEVLKSSRPFTFATDITAASTVDGVAALIQEVQPRVVFVDGVYLMQSSLKDAEPGSEAALRDISRSFKRLAQSTKTTIVISSQASQNRVKGGKLTLASGMYTQAFGQDANIVLGTQRVDPPDANDEETFGPAQVTLSVLASRSGPKKQVHLEWDWDNGSVKELDADTMKQKLDRTRNPTPGTEDDATW